MEMKTNTRFNHLLSEGIAAVKGKDFEIAETYLQKASDINPHDSRPWIWLTETTSDLSKKIDYMESAVAADPLNAKARHGLALLKGKINAEELYDPDNEDQPNSDGEPVQASTLATYQCSNCGAQIKFSVDDRKLVCGHCGFTQLTHNVLASSSQAQVLDFVLPTQRGHDWSQAQVHLACEKCGATSIWPPGQTSLECPFCLSSHLVGTKKPSEIVDPSAIGLFQIDDHDAKQITKEWFQTGLTVPDDLVEIINKTRLTHAYYPFWAIDGTLEFKWHCEVNEGSNDSPRWVSRSGTEFEIFDRILVSGTKMIAQDVVRKLGDFKIKELLDFQPQYLAGWPSISYDVPLSVASLTVREQVSKKVRRELHARIEPHEEKRGVRTGTLHWRNMTFKLVLLPIFTGFYSYKNRDFHFFINGISGGITGEKPRANAKFAALILVIVLSVVLLIAVAVIVLSFLGIM